MDCQTSTPLLPPGRRRRASWLLVACLLLGGCSFFEAHEQLRGNRVDAEQLKELVPGTSTRADVTALIGSPTARATFDDNTWIYISEVTRPRIGRVQGVLSQDVVLLSFSEQGVLQDVKTLNQDELGADLGGGTRDTIAGHRGHRPATVVRQHRPVQCTWRDPHRGAIRRGSGTRLLSRTPIRLMPA